MKEYKKAEMIAKNLPTGSYAAGCPEHHYIGNWDDCKKCECTK